MYPPSPQSPPSRGGEDLNPTCSTDYIKNKHCTRRNLIAKSVGDVNNHFQVKNALRILIPFATVISILITATSAFSQEGKKPSDPNGIDWSIFPFAGASTDIGVSFGAIGSVAKLDKDYTPYRWRGQFEFCMSVKDGDSGVMLPFHYDFVRFDFPDLAGGKLRLFANGMFYLNSIYGYFGMGNNSPVHAVIPSPNPDTQKQHQYYLTQYIAELLGQMKLGKGWHALGVVRLKYNTPSVYDGSALSTDMGQQDPHAGPLVRGVYNHGVIQFGAGMQYNSRDKEEGPNSGMLHELSVRYSPGIFAGTTLDFGGVTADLRFYHPFIKQYLVLAVRLFGDVLFGAPPLEELGYAGAFNTYEMIGGSFGIRGVPLGRFYGKAKAMGSLELRSMFFGFRLWQWKLLLGMVAFVDTGRVWADLQSTPSLDGNGLGLKYGVGGGPRLQVGEAFTIRCDIAYSPNAGDAGGWPIGVYVQIGHMF